MSNFGESVDDDKESIMTLLRSRKTGNEVHHNLVPFPFRNREGLQSSSRSLVFCLDATANVTFINITSNVLLHVLPPGRTEKRNINKKNDHFFASCWPTSTVDECLGTSWCCRGELTREYHE